jgi:hypothetical protein
MMQVASAKILLGVCGRRMRSLFPGYVPLQQDFAERFARATGARPDVISKRKRSENLPGVQARALGEVADARAGLAA